MKRPFAGCILLIAQWLGISLAHAQDDSVVLDDLAFVIEQSFNREQLLTAMQQFHTNTGVGLIITTVYDGGVYTTSAQQTEAEWLKRELGISLFITLDRDKAYQQCLMQVTPAVELLLPAEDRQRIQQQFMEYYFLGDFTTDDAFTQGVLVGLTEMEKRILEKRGGREGLKELLTEALEYLNDEIGAKRGSKTNLSLTCLSENEEHLVLISEQIEKYMKEPEALLENFSEDYIAQIEQFVAKNDSPQKGYQSVLTGVEWETSTCEVYRYLDDMVEGRGDVASTRNQAISVLIDGFRNANLLEEASFSVALDRIYDGTNLLYPILGTSGVRVSITDGRTSVPYPFEEKVSAKYSLREVEGQGEVAGISFTDQAVFQLYEANWIFGDTPKLFLHTQSNVTVGPALDSKTLLADYLTGRYDYNNIQTMINKIITSHQQGAEVLNLGGELDAKSVYARNIDFGNKGSYDLYLQRSGDFSEDVNSFYNYVKTSVTKVMGFSGDFAEYRVISSSGGTTTITLPASQAKTFEKKVLKLHGARSGKWYLDMLTAIRTANLNEDDRADLTEFGGDGGLSPVFKVKHEDEKVRLMVGKPLLGKGMTNKVNTTLQPSFTIGTVDNAIDKAYKWQKYEFLNASGTGSSHNTTVSVSIAQAEMFETYMLLPKETSEVLIDGINWRGQFNNYFSSYTCFKPKNQCCYQAAKAIVEQFKVTTNRLHSIDVAELVSPTDYKTVRAIQDFEKGLEYLESTIKSNKQGGKPVVVGAHYIKPGVFYNTNNATRHFVVVVGKGYDKDLRQDYYTFYEVGTPDRNIAISKKNKLYVHKVQRKIAGVGANGKYYTVTEIRENY